MRVLVTIDRETTNRCEIPQVQQGRLSKVLCNPQLHCIRSGQRLVLPPRRILCVTNISIHADFSFHYFSFSPFSTKRRILFCACVDVCRVRKHYQRYLLPRVHVWVTKLRTPYGHGVECQGQLGVDGKAALRGSVHSRTLALRPQRPSRCCNNNNITRLG